MANGRFLHMAGNIRYYRLPVEAWRGLLDNPAGVLKLCKKIMCADCYNALDLSQYYGWNFTDERAFAQYKKEGEAYLNGLNIKVSFIISKEMFWQYDEDYRSGTVSEWDWLLLLWWMALHTIDGGRQWAVHNATNTDVFRRAAGFSNWVEFKKYQWAGDEAILRYIAKPARVAARIREDLMLKFDTFHAYSVKGKRGWCFMLGTKDRQAAFEMMVRHMADRKSPRQQFREDLKKMQANAREKIDSG